MSENAGQDNVVDQITDAVSQGDSVEQEVAAPESTGINPAWNEYLEVLPSSLHSQAIPFLTQWDKNYQEGIQKVHSEYEPYKRYRDDGIQPDQLDYALNVLQQIESNPAEVIKAIQAYMGEDEGQGLEEVSPSEQQVQNPEDLPEVFQHPEFIKMQKMVEQMAQIMVQQRTSETERKEYEKFNQEWEAAEKTYGELDHDWVISRMLVAEDNGKPISVDEAAKQFKAWEKEQETKILQRIRKPGPPVLDDSGSVPQTNVPVAKLPGKDRRNLVAQMLSQAKQQNG